VLSQEQISAFLADGYVALRGAVPARLVRACQDVIWAELGQRGVRRDDPATWTAPVVRIGCQEGGPFAGAGTQPVVQAACCTAVALHGAYPLAGSPSPAEQAILAGLAHAAAPG
jgi:hypothetical protein